MFKSSLVLNSHQLNFPKNIKLGQRFELEGWWINFTSIISKQYINILSSSHN